MPKAACAAITVAPVCGARTLAEGRPPMGIACAQQDVSRVYPLPDDPERCLEDFAALAAEQGRGEKGFLEAKIKTARFYADHFMVQAPALRDTVVKGGAGVMALSDEQFLAA